MPTKKPTSKKTQPEPQRTVPMSEVETQINAQVQSGNDLGQRVDALLKRWGTYTPLPGMGGRFTPEFIASRAAEVTPLKEEYYSWGGGNYALIERACTDDSVARFYRRNTVVAAPPTEPVALAQHIASKISSSISVLSGTCRTRLAGMSGPSD
jgi:hypothetical protein